MSKKKISLNENSSPLITELYDEFLKEKEVHGASKATIETYRGTFKRITTFIGKETTINQLDKNLVTSFINFLMSSNLAVSTINHYIRELRTFAYWSMYNGYIYPQYRISLVKGQETVKETYSLEELERLLKKPKNAHDFVEWRDWAIINWVLGTGNRVNTIINVRLCDVDLHNGYIYIRQQKNKHANEIPMDSSLMAVVKEYIRKWRHNALSTDFLFCNVYGEQLTANGLKLTINKYNKSRNVQKTSMHAFRHTFAKMWVMNGGDVFKLQKILGHSTLDMTRKYVNLYGADLKSGFDDISPLNTIIQKNSSRRKIY